MNFFRFWGGCLHCQTTRCWNCLPHSLAYVFYYFSTLALHVKSYSFKLCCAVLCWVALSCLTLCELKDCRPPGLFCPWDSPGKNTAVGCCALFQGIFLTQGSNQCLLDWQVDSLPLHHLGSPEKCFLCPNNSLSSLKKFPILQSQISYGCSLL